ncbi:MAG: hypothetical protein N2512_05115 [Armatimonadetes bacterium]|nr:hypothetical protein [Armatimonadota bacterium]
MDKEPADVGMGPPKALVVAFACAVVLVGALAPRALWQWGYTVTAKLWVCLAILWLIELMVYPRIGRSGRMGCAGGVLIGLFVRAGMAAAAAGADYGTDTFPRAFVRYYGQFWLGAGLQVLMATMLLWLLSDLVPAVRQLEEVRTAASRRRGRGDLLSELLAEARKGATEAKPVPTETPTATEEGSLEMPQPPVSEATPPASDEEPIAAEEAPAAEPASVEAPGPFAGAGSTDISDQDTSELEPVRPEGTTVTEPLAAQGISQELVRAAVLDAARRATGVDDLRYLAWPEPPSIIANPPSEADERTTAAAIRTAAGAAGALAEAGLLGSPDLVVLVFRSAGMVLVAAMEAIVAVRYMGPPALGSLVLQGRRIVAELQAPWPEISCAEDVRTSRLAEAAASCDALVSRAAETGQYLAWFQVGATEDLVVVSSSATDMATSAHASAALWHAASELGRQCVHASLRRVLICCQRGAVAAGTVRRADGGTLCLVRIAPGVQPGMAAAEIETLAALCENIADA